MPNFSYNSQSVRKDDITTAITFALTDGNVFLIETYILIETIF